MSDENNVRVCVRIRPLLDFELQDTEAHIVRATALSDGRTVRVTACTEQRRKIETQHFRFDCVFPPTTEQIEVFSASGVEFYCDAAMEGYTATIICFGQTGSGKTYTMMGPTDIDNECSVAVANPMAPDMVPKLGLEYRAAHYICRQIQEANLASNGQVKYTLKASFTEIYNESVNDLLQDKENLKIRWAQTAQAFFIEQLMIVTCDNVDDVLAVLAEGNNNRKRASHRLNQDSSRSHVIFTLYIEKHVLSSGRGGHVPPPTMGKINFVDLAGSERLRDSGSTGALQEETRSINKSLFALGQVISCLASRQENVFVPYRDSNLTKLLMDSLGGGCRTLMVACVTPAAIHIENTISTLKYASRTKNIVNSMPRVRTDIKRQQLFELQTEVELLRAENAQLNLKVSQLMADGAKGRPSSYTPPSPPPAASPAALEPLRTSPALEPQQPSSRGQGWGQHPPSGIPLSLMPRQQQQQQLPPAYPMQPPQSSSSTISITSTRSNQRMLSGTPPPDAAQQPLPGRNGTPPAPLLRSSSFQQPPVRHEMGDENRQPRDQPENPMLRGEVEQLRAMIAEAEDTFSPVKPDQRRRSSGGAASLFSRPAGTSNPLAPSPSTTPSTGVAPQDLSRPLGLQRQWPRDLRDANKPPSLLDRPQFQSMFAQSAVPPPEPMGTAVDSAGFRPPSPKALEGYGFRPARRQQPVRLSLHLPTPADAAPVEDQAESEASSAGGTFQPALPAQRGHVMPSLRSDSPPPNRSPSLEHEVFSMREQLLSAQQEIRQLQQMQHGSGARQGRAPLPRMKYT